MQKPSVVIDCCDVFLSQMTWKAISLPIRNELRLAGLVVGFLIVRVQVRQLLCCRSSCLPHGIPPCIVHLRLNEQGVSEHRAESNEN